eukprot:scaffold43133_cov19-Tisochrysis_lutea.AAC.6
MLNTSSLSLREGLSTAGKQLAEGRGKAAYTEGSPSMMGTPFSSSSLVNQSQLVLNLVLELQHRHTKLKSKRGQQPSQAGNTMVSKKGGKSKRAVQDTLLLDELFRGASTARSQASAKIKPPVPVASTNQPKKH